MGSASWWRSPRTVPAAISIALVAIVAWPVVRSPYDDGFPLSTYPMFATPRKTTMTLDYAVGVTGAGERRSIPPALLGTREVLQAFTLLARAVAAGARGTEPLCARIAAEVATRPDYADVAWIEIVSGTHDAVDYLVRGRHGHEIVRTRCAVTR